MTGGRSKLQAFRSLPAQYLLAALLLVLLPVFVTGRYELQMINLILIYIVISAGLNITLGYAGQVSVAQSALAAIGAYCSALMVIRLDWPFVPAALVGVAAAGFIGAVMGLLTFRVRTHYLLLVTFGFHVIILVFISNLVELTGGPVGLSVPRMVIGGWQARTQFDHYLAFAPITLLLLFAAERLKGSRTGLAMYALKNNEKGARAVGISPIYYRTLAMALGGLYAGVGGVMFAFLIRFLGPGSFDLHSALLYILIIVVGGLGSTWGLVLSTVLLTFLAEELKTFAESWVLIYGLLIIIVMIVMPGGFAGLGRRMVGRIAVAKVDAASNTGRGPAA